jgi:hypothetical protein
MRIKALLICALFLASMLLVVATPVSAAPNYEWTHYDPKDDVLRIRAGGDFKFATWDNIEITKITSTFIDNSANPLEDDKIELKMKVEGTIQMNDDYKYVFIIKADNDDYIFAAYQNNAPVGWKYGDPTPMPNFVNGIEASGVGTDTLTIEFNENAIGPPNSVFEVHGASVYSEGDYLRYIDMAQPDKLIRITEPSDGSTVSGTVTIRGVIRDSIENQPEGDVKIRIDGGTWEDVTGSDPWSYQLDTTTLSGDVRIEVKVDNAGSVLDNSEDEIIIKVDQNTGSYDSFNQKPSVHVGDEFHYKALGNPEIFGIGISVTNQMDITVEDFESITVDGETFDTYRLYTFTHGEQKLGYINYENTLQRWTWREFQSFGTVKEYTESQVEVTGRPPTTVRTTSVYDPPLETHNDFSVSEGFINDVTDNRWEFTTTVDSNSTTQAEGDDAPTTNPPYTDNHDITGECLYYKQTHSIPGMGTFNDIYLIRTYYENPGISIVEYYSPELGVPVQIDTFDPSGNMLFSLGLDDYTIRPFSVIIDKVTFDPTDPAAETENNIIVDVKNIGVEDASNVEVTVMDGDREVASETISSILVDQTESQTIKWTPKGEGSHTITVILKHQGDEFDRSVSSIDVKAAPPDGGFDMFFILIIIVIIIAVILVVVLMKLRGKKEGEVPPTEAQSETTTVETAPAAAAGGVVVGSEPAVQAAPAQAAQPQMNQETIQCPSCKNGFEIQYESKPVRVKCPNCGMEGVLN